MSDTKRFRVYREDDDWWCFDDPLTWPTSYLTWGEAMSAANEAANYWAYWSGLTDEEKAEEERLMAYHVDQDGGDWE
ncbi:MAG: hypothetical protein NVSMB4_06010 [Acidimicrobiales bacterium]